jgi:nucleoside-diphosphate-sugar epimerase
MKTKILITGGSGFIGSNLIEFYLSLDSFEILNIDIKTPRNPDHSFLWVNVDVRDLVSLKHHVINFNPDFVIHLAAQTDLNQDVDISYYSTNIIGVENILEAVKSINLKRIIIASSMLVNKVGYQCKSFDDYNPDTIYGESKKLTEQITKKYNLNWTLVRPTSIWGPWFSIPYYNFFNYVISGLYFSISVNDSAIKTYGYVKNTCKQIDKLLMSDLELVNHKTFFLGDNPPLNISNWADKISLIVHNRKVVKIHKFVFLVSCIVGQFLIFLGWKKFPLNFFRFKNMTTNNVIDLSKTINIIGETSDYNIDLQIEETIKWIKSR